MKYIKTLFNSLKKAYDYIILDLSPDLYPLNKTIISYSDSVLSIINPDSYGKISLLMINEFLSNEKEILNENNGKNKFLGYVLNKCKIRNGKMIESVLEYKNYFDTFCEDNKIRSFRGFIEDFNGRMNSDIHNEKLFFSDYNQKYNLGKIYEIRRELDSIITNIFLNDDSKNNENLISNSDQNENENSDNDFVDNKKRKKTSK